MGPRVVKSSRVLSASVERGAVQQTASRTVGARPKRKLVEVGNAKVVRGLKVDKIMNPPKKSQRTLASSSSGKVKNPPPSRRMVSSIRRSEAAKMKETTVKKKGITFLESKSVSEEVGAVYSKHFASFRNFCKEQKVTTTKAEVVDGILAEYLDVIFMDGKGLSEAEKTVAAVEFFNVKVKGGLLRSRRALKGWRKQHPPQSRVPLPKLITYGMCMLLLHQCKRDKALKLILDFDTYMRPGESFDLRPKDLVPPVRGTNGTVWSFATSTLGFPTRWESSTTACP